MTAKIKVTKNSTPKGQAKHLAVVTGGTCGTGAAVARRVEADGFDVIALERSLGDATYGRFVACGLADPQSVAGVARVIVAQAVPEVLVHVGRWFAIASRWLRRLVRGILGKGLELSLLAAVRVDREIVPEMLKLGRGAIVYVTSIQADAAVVLLNDCQPISVGVSTLPTNLSRVRLLACPWVGSLPLEKSPVRLHS